MLPLVRLGFLKFWSPKKQTILTLFIQVHFCEWCNILMMQYNIKMLLMFNQMMNCCLEKLIKIYFLINQAINQSINRVFQ